ncbi:hypothetical protein DS745_06710 [Anaerobacillus alkaliphilus]|uniref:Uncharacterized protein n=1 Tax=Anaerobacillus alkaliphilus TaxID=1548597 RepID=A0A4Q0VW32_9BACI|nr:hypothetical protein [Anaerobacillus alkaliphilus]RXJ02389.1 hypothetical protein DS745_06710 [Anaerobacillus alkaliphilus]
MQINIRNIRVNSISTIGSLNIGKTVFTDNRSSSAQFPKGNYEETEPENGEEENNEENGEPIEFNPPMGVPPIIIP